jgi:hypothetical protein
MFYISLYPSSLPGRSGMTSANSVASFCNFIIFPKELTHAGSSSEGPEGVKWELG